MLTMNDAVMTAGKNGACTITAPGKSDFFIDPRTGTKHSNAPFCHKRIKGDFVASNKVGLVAQSPVGNGCSVEFSRPKIGTEKIVDMRKGK